MAANAKADFLGCGWGFPPRFDKTRDSAEVAMVSAETDIWQSLLVLFSTVPGERVMLPDYGCPLHLHVFDSIDRHHLTLLKGLISDAVLRYEPRILLEDVLFDTSQQQQGILPITLTYLIRQTNTRSNMVFPFYLKEGSNVRRIG